MNGTLRSEVPSVNSQPKEKSLFDDNGMFVSAVMYLEMFISFLIKRPICWIYSRHPLALPALILGAVAILIADSMLTHHHVHSQVLFGTLAISIIAFAAMVAVMLTPGIAPELAHVDHKVDASNWFHD